MKTNQAIAAEVLMGKWGNGQERRRLLTQSGYDYEKVQSIVNALVEGNAIPEERPYELEIIGTHFMDVDVDLNKYCGINLTFTFGDTEDADTST